MSAYGNGTTRSRTDDVASRSRGGAVIELALLVPVLLVAVVGMVDLGRASYESISIESAAHAGAQYGAQSPEHAADIKGIHKAVQAELDAAYAKRQDAKAITVDVERYCWCSNDSVIDCDKEECPTGSPPASTYVRVRVDKPFTSLLPYPGLPEIIMLSREAQVRAE